MTMNKWIFVFLAFGLAIACTPKTTDKIVDKTPVVVKPTMTADQLKCRTFSDLGNMREEGMTAFVLYKSELKAKNFERAYPLWQKAFRLAPKSDGRKTYHYDDGIEMFSHFASLTEDEAEKKMWADSVKYLYERKAFCYGDTDDTKAKQVYDLYYNFREQVEPSYLFGLLASIADSKGTELPEYIINPFSKILVNQITSKEIDVEEGKKYANILMESINKGLANCGTDCKNWKIIGDYSLGRLEVLERFQAFDPCDYYVTKYYPEFQAAPTDCEVIEKVAIRLKRGGCEESDAVLTEVMAAYNTNCKKEVELGPLGEAYKSYRDGSYEEAISKFDEYFATEKDKEKLAKNQLVVAKIYYRDIKDFPKARQYAREAIANKGNWGDPYILIGKLYASSGPICGPGTGWDSQIVTWPAIDKWNQAKSIDPSVASDANQLIRTYEKYMPAIEEVFSRSNATEGKSFYVGCWIKENTTVRSAK